MKYLPQVLLNHRRRSTLGWSLTAILLDLSGGLLSLVQLWLDKGFMVPGVKQGLGFVSIGFDVVFLLQHYVLYPRAPVCQEWEWVPQDEMEAGSSGTETFNVGRVEGREV